MQQPKLTFIHGFMGHPDDWDDIRAALPNCETFAVEIKPATDWQSSIKQLAESIPERSVLIGYSMGARLALGVALEYPKRCDGLIFVSGNPGLESTEECDQRQETDEKIASRIEEGSLNQFLESWYEGSVFASLPEAIRQSEVERKLARSAVNWPAILRANSVSQQPNYWPRWSQLSMPTIAVAGELDLKYRKIVERIEDEFGSPTLSTKVVPECGHMIHRERPNALIQIIRDEIPAR